MQKISKFSGRAAAWGAIAACSLAGGLTFMTLAASATETSGTMKPEVPACQRACYAAFGECNKAAGDDLDKQAQCKAAGNECMTKCPKEDRPTTNTNEPPKPPKPPEQVPVCQRACYAAFGECNKAAGDSEEQHAACKTAGNTCLGKCPAVHGGSPTEGRSPECLKACADAKSDCAKAAGDNADSQHQCLENGASCGNKCPKVAPPTSTGDNKTYEEAVQAARQHFLDGQKKLLEEYQHALEKAWTARMKASTK